MLTDLRRQNKLTEQKKRIVFIELHTASGKGIFPKMYLFENIRNLYVSYHIILF